MKVKWNLSGVVIIGVACVLWVFLTFMFVVAFDTLLH